MVDVVKHAQPRHKLAPVLVEGESKSKEEADKIASKFRNCPYVSFIATRETKVFFTYALPEEQLWWMKEIEKEPKRHMGLESVKVTYPEKLYQPRVMRVRYPRSPTESSFCDPGSGFTCDKCPGYSVCLGCPGTIFHKW
jgi:hypothetical protein